MDEVVTISKKDYEELLDRDAFLSALEAGGVDNWEGFDNAVKIYEEGEEV